MTMEKLSKKEQRKEAKRKKKEALRKIRRSNNEDLQEVNGKTLRDKLRDWFTLKQIGGNAQLFLSDEGVFPSSMPLFADDIKAFLISVTQQSSANARWFRGSGLQDINRVVFVIINGLSKEQYCEHFSCFERMNNLYFKLFEFISPVAYGKNIVESLCFKPYLKEEQEFAEPVAKRSKITKTVSKSDLLLSPQQMLLEQYPLPCIEKYREYCPTNTKYERVSSLSPLYALDCEMVLTKEGKMEVARVSIVDEVLNVVYDTYVCPKLPVKDYLTKFSGITESTLQGVTVTLEDVQEKIKQILPSNAILCGQSLNFDLNALHMTHPYIIDTSVIYNLSGRRNKKNSLKHLAETLLGEQIQCDENGHSPIEDSKTAMRLVLLKFKYGLQHGNMACAETEIMPHTSKCEREESSTCVIGNDLITKWYLQQQLQDKVKLIKMENNKNTLKQARKEMLQHFYTLCLLNIKQDSESDFANSLTEIDKAISKIYKKCTQNSVLVVALSGCIDQTSGSFQSGLCMIKFKVENLMLNLAQTLN